LGVWTKLEQQKIEDEAEGWARGARTVLRAYREEANLSQEELAARIGWTPPMVVNLESGKKAMHIGYVVLVARAVDIEPATVFTQIADWTQNQARGGPSRLKRFPR
jgi:transcriptional regulator with XRE-family HTH domain